MAIGYAQKISGLERKNYQFRPKLIIREKIIDKLLNHVRMQLMNIIICDDDVQPFISEAFCRTIECFKLNKDKNYFSNQFSVYHSGLCSIFLYYLSNTVYKKSGNNDLAAKIYYLNKILHSVDWFHAIELPTYWGVEQPIGSVLGRLSIIMDYFCIKVVQLVVTRISTQP